MTVPTKIYRLLAVLLLLAVGAARLGSVHKSVSVQAYDARIKNSVSLVPDHIGPWVGQDVPVEERALKLLLPNVMVNRQYVNVENGQAVGFELVQCPDAHDIVGHYPLRCYPADGWNADSSREFHWRLAGLEITGMEYKFSRSFGPGSDPGRALTVWNFLMRPGQPVLKDMDSLSDSIVGVTGQAAGAGQVQVCFFDSSLSDDQEQSIAEVLVVGYKPVIDAILAKIPS
jgi:hypothetical protein